VSAVASAPSTGSAAARGAPDRVESVAETLRRDLLELLGVEETLSRCTRFRPRR